MKTCDRLDPGIAWLIGLLGVLIALGGAVPAARAAGPAMPSPGSHQREGAAHVGPPAYHAMCARNPQLCKGDRMSGRARKAGPPANLTPARWQRLVRLNARINRQIHPAEDRILFGEPDFWTRGRTAGDCDDYMVAKKLALIEAGWPADQLLYAVVEGWATDYHAVLIVRTDRGDLVLDNLEPRILHWQKTGYQFVIRQSAARPATWVRVLDGRNTPKTVRTAHGRMR